MLRTERRMATKVQDPGIVEELGIKVGDIFVESWGYDQTNVNFYKVVGVTRAASRSSRSPRAGSTAPGTATRSSPSRMWSWKEAAWLATASRGPCR